MVIEKKSPNEKVKAFFGKIGTRNLIIFGAVLLIVAAVAVNFIVLGQNKPGNYTGYDEGSGMTNVYGDESKTESYFSTTQVSRTRARDEALEVLKSVVDDESADEASRNVAYTSIAKIAEEMENESNIESLVVAKGFAQCVAVINDMSASVVVSSEDDLTPAELSQINEIVYTQAGILPENITIIKK